NAIPKVAPATRTVSVSAESARGTSQRTRERGSPGASGAAGWLVGAPAPGAVIQRRPGGEDGGRAQDDQQPHQLTAAVVDDRLGGRVDAAGGALLGRCRGQPPGGRTQLGGRRRERQLARDGGIDLAQP